MEIIFAGGSHYGMGAFRSLQKKFEKIYVISDSGEHILSMKRKTDIVIEDFDDVETKTVFLGGYARLITKQQLERKTYINVHGALLPKYRGMHSTFWAIMNGEKQLGVTFHIVDEYMDSGDILMQFEFPYVGQTVSDINNQIDDLVEKYTGEVVADYLLGRIQPRKQEPSIAVFGAKRNISDCIIDFNMDHIMLDRLFHALTRPYPFPMLVIRGELYEALDHILVQNEYFGPVGRAVNIDGQGVWIKTKDGYLIIRKVKKREEDTEVLLSDLIKIGYRFTGSSGGALLLDDLEELDKSIANFLICNRNAVPDRWKKAVAFFYTDANIRKLYLSDMNVLMEEGTYSNLGLLTDASSRFPVRIGKNVSIGPGICLITESNPNNSTILQNIPYIKNKLLKSETIIIEDEAWIGANVTILPGIKIGRGAIVGAGAVVIDDVEEFSIYAGVPAKMIRRLERNI